MKFTLFCALVLASCTKPNPAVCCLDQADCSEVGLSEVRNCSAGLACVEHQCQTPSCATTGCGANAPVCNTTTDVCDLCSESSQCSRFEGTPICDLSHGACVECVMASDCSSTEPVCDANTCRGCTLDSECSSGACGDDGSCIAEGSIVYLDPIGTDSGSCSRDAPCRGIAFGVSRTTAVRNHIVLSPGGYIEASISIDTVTTAASQLFIHGGGASISYPSFGENPILTSYVPLVIRDVDFAIQSTCTAALDLRTSNFRVERVKMRGGCTGIFVVSSSVVANDILVEDATNAFRLSGSGHLELDRAEVRRGNSAILADDFGTSVKISNVLAWGTNNLAFDLSRASGTIEFSTVVDSGTDTGTGPRAVLCGQSMTMRSSIVWAPGLSTRVPVNGCNLATTIAGPTSTPGASNIDPQFKDAATRDYHLAPSSPARDMVDSGPALDFENDARPVGVRFDIGADEAQ